MNYKKLLTILFSLQILFAKAQPFIEQKNIDLPHVQNSSARWVDYDTDGDLDIFICGTYTSVIYKNNGDNSFTELQDLELLESFTMSAAWGDYDNDGDLDILITGEDGSKLYRNETDIVNNPPSSPTGLRSVLFNDSVTFYWEQSSDIETPSQGLNYNLYLYKPVNDSLVVSPHAFRYSSIFNGKRLLAQPGSIQWSENGYTIYGNFSPEYLWSIQAIDPGFASSTFPAEQNLQPISSSETLTPESRIVIFPNPTTSIIYIQGVEYITGLEILCLQGSRVKEINALTEAKPVDVSFLQNGLYLIKIQTNCNETIFRKFIKQ